MEDISRERATSEIKETHIQETLMNKHKKRKKELSKILMEKRLSFQKKQDDNSHKELNHPKMKKI